MKAALALVFTLLISCGSIRGRTRYISVDSKPRGVKIYDQSGKSLGETPLFYKIKSRSELIFKVDQHKAQSVHQFPCQLRWLRLSLENAPLPLITLAAGPPFALGLYGAAILTDTMSGAAYHCPERITLSNFNHEAKTQPSCPRYIVAGLSSLSREAQKQVTQVWWAEHKLKSVKKNQRPKLSSKRESSCDLNIIQDVDAWSYRLNLPLEIIDKAAMKTWHEEHNRVNRFGFETNASHILHLSNFPTSAKGSSHHLAQIKVTELDLHTMETADFTISIPQKVLNEIGGAHQNVRSLIKASRSLIPNTIGLSGMVRNFQALDSDQKEIRVDRENSQSLALTHVSHPNAFHAWDYTLKLGFGGNFDLNQRFELDDQAKTAVDFNRYAADATLTFTGHTPLGAIGIGVGPGLGVYQLSDDRLDKDTHFVGEFHSRLHYTFFITEQVIGRFEVHTTQVGGSIGQKVFSRFTDASFMLGYYIPTLQRLATDLIE